MSKNKTNKPQDTQQKSNQSQAENCEHQNTENRE